MNLTQFNPLKCLTYADKIQTILDGDIPVPVLVNLDLTNRCNYKCRHCSVEKYISNRVEMSRVVASKIINELADYGMQSIIFSGGGEPTTHPNFLQIIQLAADRGMKIGLATNGSLLYKFVGKLPLKSFRYIRVSFDAGCKETYTKIHNAQEGDFERVLSVATYFNECQVGMGFLVTADNYLEIPAAINLAATHKFDYVSIRPAVYGKTPSESQLKTASDASNNFTSQASVKVYPLKYRFQSLTNREKHPCRATPLTAVITADGELNICCQHRGNPAYQWGNLCQESFKSLWDNQLHRALIKEVENRPCPDCACKLLHYNEIIEKVFVKDTMHLGFL